MSAYVELYLRGAKRLVMEVNSIAGVAGGADLEAIADEEHPLELILRGGESIPGIVAMSVSDILHRMEAARRMAKESSLNFYVFPLAI